MKRIFVLLVLAAAASVVLAAPASAHPLGNFTTTTYAGLVVGSDALTVDHVVDLAEVPTLQARRTFDADGDERISGAEGTRYRQQACAEVASNVQLRVDDLAVPLGVERSGLTFPAGAGGLDTLRLECQLRAEVEVGSASVTLADGNYGERVGWHEVTAVGDGMTLEESDVPETSLSSRLTNYPKRSPLDQRTAALDVRSGGPLLDGDGGSSTAFDAADRRGDRLTAAFTDLVADRQVTPGFGLLAVLLALGLGAVHALQPGHGKTLMAAYVVGEGSRLRSLADIGLTVALTHTAGVLVLGLVVSASAAIAPEQVLTGASVASGVLLALVGLGLLVRRLRGRRTDHGHGHSHSHPHAHGHSHGHAHPHEPAPERSRRSVVAMGFAGGLVPSPSALVVLLGATALGRVWFGLLLVLAYGLGLAAALVAAGLLLLRARPRLESWAAGSGPLGALTRALPVVTAAALLVGGLSLAGRALVLA
ncbi:hypothetical protein BH18ACT1_BH18ACT1_13790 [soil metagenome]